MDHGNTKFPRLDSPLLYKSLFINTFLSEDIVKNSLSKVDTGFFEGMVGAAGILGLQKQWGMPPICGNLRITPN